jgi:hypothetical protein
MTAAKKSMEPIEHVTADMLLAAARDLNVADETVGEMLTRLGCEISNDLMEALNIARPGWRSINDKTASK